ncbi:putative integral membrane protein [Brugia pahangi]
MKYILIDNTGIDNMLNRARNTKLQTTAIIVIGLFAIFSTLLNLILLITILLSRKLRSIQLFILFCNFAILNIFDILSGMFIPFLFIINDNWLSDMTICRLSVTLEQFVNMELLMSIMLMAIIQAILSYFPNQFIFNNWRILAFIIVLWLISICLVLPIFTHHIPVIPSEFWYNCSIDKNVPILYPIVCILIYSICLIIILICLAALLSRNNQYKDQLVSIRSNENLSFNRHTSSFDYDYLNHLKLILILIILFIIFDGPFIMLNFFIQIRNSNVLLTSDNAFMVPQDAYIILNWLRLMYPLLAPILIYAVSDKIWLNIKRCIFCDRSETISIRDYSNEQDSKEKANDKSAK